MSDTAALSLPPLLAARPLPPGADPLAEACAGAAAGRFGAGDFLWAEPAGRLSAALVLEPEVGRARCPEMLYLAMVAFGDALGALAPPEVAVTHSWPSVLRVNGGRAGRADLVAGPGDPPDWLVLGLDLALLPGPETDTDPGADPDRTDLWNEGCAEVAPRELLEAFARHLVAAIHGWDEDGFGPVHTRWWGRRDGAAPMALPGHPAPTGLDEHGNALWQDAAGTARLTDTLAALDRLRTEPAP